MSLLSCSTNPDFYPRHVYHSSLDAIGTTHTVHVHELSKILVRTCVASSTPNPSTLLTSSAFPSYCWKTVDIAVTLRLTENGAAIQHTAARMTDKLKECGLPQKFVFIIEGRRLLLS